MWFGEAQQKLQIYNKTDDSFRSVKEVHKGGLHAVNSDGSVMWANELV